MNKLKMIEFENLVLFMFLYTEDIKSIKMDIYVEFGFRLNQLLKYRTGYSELLKLNKISWFEISNSPSFPIDKDKVCPCEFCKTNGIKLSGIFSDYFYIESEDKNVVNDFSTIKDKQIIDALFYFYYRGKIVGFR